MEETNYLITKYGNLLRATKADVPFEVFRMSYSADTFATQIQALQGTALYLVEGFLSNGDTTVFVGEVKDGKDLMKFSPDGEIIWKRFYILADSSNQYLTVNTVKYVYDLFYLQANYATDKYDTSHMEAHKSTMGDRDIVNGELFFTDTFKTLDVIGLHLKDIATRNRKRKQQEKAAIKLINQHFNHASPQMPFPGAPSMNMPITPTANVQNDLASRQSWDQAWYPMFIEKLDEPSVTNLYDYFSSVNQRGNDIHNMMGIIYTVVTTSHPQWNWKVLTANEIGYIGVLPDIDQSGFVLLVSEVHSESGDFLRIALNKQISELSDPNDLCYTHISDPYQTYVDFESSARENTNAIVAILKQVI